MKATQCLRDEHQVILQVIDCFEIALQQARDSGEIKRVVFEPFVEFFRGFADKCHHCKEEDRLFPVMEKNGVPRDGGPIGVMLFEHEQGRLHVRAMAENLEAADRGDAAAVAVIFQHGDDYIELLRNHIGKEDHCLFGMAEQAVQGADLSSLCNAYRDAEAEPTYRETFATCSRIADKLTRTYSVCKPGAPSSDRCEGAGVDSA